MESANPKQDLQFGSHETWMEFTICANVALPRWCISGTLQCWQADGLVDLPKVRENIIQRLQKLYDWCWRVMSVLLMAVDKSSILSALLHNSCFPTSILPTHLLLKAHALWSGSRQWTAEIKQEPITHQVVHKHTLELGLARLEVISTDEHVLLHSHVNQACSKQEKIGDMCACFAYQCEHPGHAHPPQHIRYA
eukprot:1160892-Pelagomonas_calceolata.AAC.6